MSKHKHEYKLAGETDLETNKWMAVAGTTAIRITKTHLVLMCHCGEMLVKPKENNEEQNK